MTRWFRYHAARPLGAACLLALWVLTTGAEGGSWPDLPGWLVSVLTVLGGGLVLWGKNEEARRAQSKQIESLELRKADAVVLAEIDKRLTGHHETVTARLAELRTDMRDSLGEIRQTLDRLQGDR